MPPNGVIDVVSRFLVVVVRTLPLIGVLLLLEGLELLLIVLLGGVIHRTAAYRTLLLAPDSVQEMCDLTLAAFDLADEYRNPVVVLADAYIGQMMEPVAFPDRAVRPPMPASSSATARASSSRETPRDSPCGSAARPWVSRIS